MNGRVAYLALAIAVIALGIAVLRGPGGKETAAPKNETAFARVMRTRTLRCAYATWPPYLAVDPNTKKLSGVDHAIFEAIGKAANIKIEWQEEVGYGVVSEQLGSGKQDAFCANIWLSAYRAQGLELTSEAYYMPLYAYVRADDNRFDENLRALNDDKVTVAFTDGSAQKTASIAAFPKAQHFAVPQMADQGETLIAVARKKADVVLADPLVILDYNRNNPKAPLKHVEGTGPVRTYGAVYAVAKDETALRNFLDAALKELLNDGTIDRIIGHYEAVPGAILRVATPYAPPVTRATGEKERP